jgi:hypothetical protein
VLTGASGERLGETPWRPNLVLDGAFKLLAALLKRDPGAEGILYWAVGAGHAGWDEQPAATVARTSRLTAEVLRLQVPREAIRFVDARGVETPEESPDLEVRLAFVWPDEAVTLREFGVFGGDATDQADSGIMINHVIHRRLVLEPGQRLSRELRLSFGRSDHRRWLDVPTNWLSDSEPRVVGGVGTQYAAALSRMGILTVEALARSDPHARRSAIPRGPLIELRAKARLALRIASDIRAPQTLHDLTVLEVLQTPPSELARAAGVVEAEVVLLLEQLSTLELALDHRFLRRRTVQSLVGGAS